MKFKFFLFSVIVIYGCAKQPQHFLSSDITKIELQAHIQYLTSEKLEGRKPGTVGNSLAADYIANSFKSYGLIPIGDNQTFYQNFTVPIKVIPGKNNKLSITLNDIQRHYTSEIDFRPFSFSNDTLVTGEVVFAGYGISSDSLQYDDYANLNVEGKIVIVLRFTPDAGRPESKFHGYESHYRKALTAREKGAVGIIMITGPADEETPKLVPFQWEQRTPNVGIAAINVLTSHIESLFIASGIDKSLRDIQQIIYDTKSPISFSIPNVTISIQSDIDRIYGNTSNVIAMVEGWDPILKNEYIVIGAHYDHIGFGGPGSGSLLPETTAVHPGADDNASGTAALLEIAQYFSNKKSQNKRSLIFAAFSAEEMGLLGSNYFCNNSPVPIENVITMINMDMIGRMKDNTLIVEGIGTSPIWKDLLEKENMTFKFDLKLKQGGFGPSDHASFYAKNIPTLFFFTNLHSDYHKPSDTWEKINYEGEEKIAHFIVRIVTILLDDSTKPIFTQVQQTIPESSGNRRGTRASLGVIPDFSQDEGGLKISGTRPGSPAEKAGLQSGDIITRFGGKEVKNIYDFNYLLSEFKPGDEVEIFVKRNNELVILKAVLGAR